MDRGREAELEAGAPGSYGYSVFSINRADLRRLRDLRLEYVRAMQNIIAASTPGECVGLYAAQLLDLSAVDNALAG